MASEELRAIVETMRSQRGGVSEEGLSIEQRRETMESTQANIPIPADIEIMEVDINGIPGCWVSAPEIRDNTVVIYYHGGGYVMGSLKTHQELMGRISRACKAKVLGVDYRLAPEHKFPAAVDDGVISYRWLLEQGIAPSRIMLAGDSAGGGLALVTLLSLREKSIVLPAAAILFSPWTDLTASGESAISRADVDPMITIPALLDIAETYYGDANPQDPLVSPNYADLSGLPPLLIQVGDAEVLLSDASRLADNAKEAGVIVDYQVWDEAFHVFQALPQLPEANEALEKVGQFFNRIV